MRPMNRMSPYGEPYLESAGTALVRFTRCLLTRFGHPNDLQHATAHCPELVEKRNDAAPTRHLGIKNKRLTARWDEDYLEKVLFGK